MNNKEILEKIVAEVNAKTSQQILDEMVELMQERLPKRSAFFAKPSTDSRSLIDISITQDYINMIAEYQDPQEYIDMMMGYQERR